MSEYSIDRSSTPQASFYFKLFFIYLNIGFGPEFYSFLNSKALPIVNLHLYIFLSTRFRCKYGKIILSPFSRYRPNVVIPHHLYFLIFQMMTFLSDYFSRTTLFLLLLCPRRLIPQNHLYLIDSSINTLPLSIKLLHKTSNYQYHRYKMQQQHQPACGFTY